MLPFRRREQQIAALTLTLLACALVYLLGVHIWFVAPRWRITDETSTLSDANQQARTLLQRERARQANLAKNEPSSTQSDTLLTGPDSGAATAQLLQMLSTQLQAVAAQGMECTVTNRTPGVPEQVGEYLQIKVGVSLECLIEPLGKLVYSLENQHPYLFVDSLSIRRMAALDGGNRLAVQMSISGYLANSVSVESTP